MKPFQPREIFATSWAWEDERCRARMESLMAGFGRPMSDIQVVTEEELPDLIRRKNWLDLWQRQGCSLFDGDPDLVFNKFRWFDDAEKKAWRERTAPILSEARDYGRSMVAALGGYPTYHHFEDGNHKRLKRDTTCWALHDLHTGWGCFHKCRYCPRGRVSTIMLNVEEWMERVDQLLADNPWQKVIRFDVETDCLILEPEYGICRDLVEHFAEMDDRYLILFSKSDNVDFLLDLEHKGHTIMLWTLSTPIVSRRIEVDTATTEERIEAARKCQAAGYPVRFKFKPIVPTRNWRQDATDMLEKLFAAVQPDNLSMETLFFRNTEELKNMFDEELLDPEFVKMMEEHEAKNGIDDPYKSIPEPFRIEIYEYYAAEVKRLSPQTPISLCAESATAWDHMAPLLGQSPYDFICNCGPACIPYLKPSSMVNAPDFKPTIAPQ
jgi:spore photoproduct lyase